MYMAVLTAHSWLRWLVIAAALLTLAQAIAGTSGRKPWTPTSGRSMAWYSIALDIQFVIGLLLYAWLSPITRAAFQDFGAAMANPALRFWAVEHIVGMVVAIALAHVGKARVAKSTDARMKYRRMLGWQLASLAVLLVSIPWPGMAAGRPLWR